MEPLIAPRVSLRRYADKMRLTIYPRDPVLRLTFLVGYFLLGVHFFYLARPAFHSYAKEIMIEGANYQSAANVLLGILWAGFSIFISFGFILEILQKKGSGRMKDELSDFEFRIVGLCIVLCLFGLINLGVSMFENESILQLMMESLLAILMIASGITFLSLISIFRPKFYKKIKHIKSVQTTSASRRV